MSGLYNYQTFLTKKKSESEFTELHLEIRNIETILNEMLNLNDSDIDSESSVEEVSRPEIKVKYIDVMKAILKTSNNLSKLGIK